MDSYAAFGEVNYSITNRLTAPTLGLRYTHEDKNGDSRRMSRAVQHGRQRASLTR